MEDVRRLLEVPAGMGDPQHQVQLIPGLAERQTIIEMQEDLHLIGKTQITCIILITFYKCQIESKYFNTEWKT